MRSRSPVPFPLAARGRFGPDRGMATGSDIKRLKSELRTIWSAIEDEVLEENPRAPRGDRIEMTRSRFLRVVDDAAREVAAEE